MSDNIPFEIQAEIIKHLPPKPLIQFRSVSKTWKSHIDNPNFISTYIRHPHPQTHHLIVTYTDPDDLDTKYVSIADDNTLPQNKTTPTVPLLVTKLKHAPIIGSSNGLFCSYLDDAPKGIAVIWNVLIGKAVCVVVPNIAPFGVYGTVVGFGVCRVTMDAKLIKITHIDSWDELDSVSLIPWQVEVFSLSDKCWRGTKSGSVFRKSVHFELASVYIDGVLYWLATDRDNTDRGLDYYNLVVSFDLTTEEFEEIHFWTNNLAHREDYDLSISKVRESLVVVESYQAYGEGEGFRVWMMVEGFFFFRIFTIKSPDMLIRGFGKSGAPIIEMEGDKYGMRPGSTVLVVYDPNTQDVINLEMNELGRSFSVYPYVETLLLLDQPDLVVYEEGKARVLSGEEELMAFEGYKQGIN